MTPAELAGAIAAAGEITTTVIFNKILIFIVLFTIVGGLLQLSYDYFRLGFDESDDYHGKNRSGFSIQTDYGTGLQYIITTKGGITPRLDINGKHIVYTKTGE